MPPHFSSSRRGEDIIERTKGNGGFAVVDSVYTIDEGRLEPPSVSKAVYWATGLI